MRDAHTQPTHGWCTDVPLMVVGSSSLDNGPPRLLRTTVQRSPSVASVSDAPTHADGLAGGFATTSHPLRGCERSSGLGQSPMHHLLQWRVVVRHHAAPLWRECVGAPCCVWWAWCILPSPISPPPLVFSNSRFLLRKGVAASLCARGWIVAASDAHCAIVP